MKKYFFLFILVPVCNPVVAQQAKDSLFTIVQKNKQDTATVKALIDFGDIILTENIDSAEGYYNKALAISKSINYWNGIALYYRSVTYYYGGRKRNREKGLHFGNEYLKQAIAHNDEMNTGKAYGTLAVVYQRFHEYDSCIYFYQKAIPVIEKTAKSSLPVIYGNMAGVYDQMQLVDKAIEYASKAQELYRIDKDTAGIVSTYINMASAYSWDTAFNEKQIDVLQKGIALSKKINNLFHLSVLYNNLAGFYMDIKKYDSALHYINEAVAVAEKSGSQTDKAELLISLANIYNTKKDYAKALSVINRVAADTAGIALPITKQRLLLDVKYESLNGLGRYKEANNIADAIIVINDSINQINNNNIALGFDEKIKKAEHEKKLAEKELKISKQKTLVQLLSIIAAALLGLGILFYLYQRKKQAASKQAILTLEKEQELIATKSSLEGQLQERGRISKEIHDELGSSLTSISLLTEVLKKRLDTNQNPEVNKISDTSAGMVDKMNEIIWALNTSNDTINSLIAYTRKFANNFLQEAGIELEFEEKELPLDSVIEGAARRNIYLTVKEAINNIVKHSGASKVNIMVDAFDNLNIHIKDNGKGIEMDNLPFFRNGLQNMKKRMEDIGGSLSVSNNNGTLITLSYPVKAA